MKTLVACNIEVNPLRRLNNFGKRTSHGVGDQRDAGGIMQTGSAKNLSQLSFGGHY